MTDLPYAIRALLKSPGFSIIAIVTLALGIGASTAIFSVVSAVLLRPLPFPQSERIVELRELDQDGRGMPFTDPNVDDLSQQSRSFQAIARYNAGVNTVVGGSEPVRTNVCAASADFFRVLNMSPFRGRLFSSANAEADPVAVVSYGFWQRMLGGRTDPGEATLRLEDHRFNVVGVLPPGAEFPPNVEVWFPASIYPKNPYRTAHNWSVAARLNTGVSLEKARAEAEAIGRRLKQEYGNQTDAFSFGVTPLRERMVKDVQGLLFVLSGAVGLLLLIACANVANLLLVRATIRRKEIALRAALGASRWQLIREFLSESIVLSLIAGVLGVFLANWGVRLIASLYHGNLPTVGKIGVDSTALLFTLAISLGTGLLLALLPALHLSKTELRLDLQESGWGSSSGRSQTRARNLLIISQVALTLVLLVGAGLLGRSFQRLLGVSPGFQTESAVAMRISQAHPETPADGRRLAQLYQRLIDRLHDQPGVIAVGGVNSLPMTHEGANGTFIIQNGAEPAKTIDDLTKEFSALSGSGRLGDADFRVASEGYFSAMRIPLLRGRFFTEADGPDSLQVAIVNQALVRRYWPNENPIGQQLQFGGMDGDLHLLRVVGVAADVRDVALDVQPRPMVYVHYRQRPGQAADFAIVLRGEGKPGNWITIMRQEARAIDPQMPTDFQTLAQVVSASLDQRRFSMVMVGLFAATALILAMVGLYGVIAYLTSQRAREIGIRMALGAQRSDVLGLVLGQSLTLVAVGVAVGILGAIAGTRLLGTLLYGVSAADFTTYFAVVLLLFLAALLASFLPARRALAVDPVVALRTE